METQEQHSNTVETPIRPTTPTSERAEEERLLESWLDGEVPCRWEGCPSAATWRAVPDCKHHATYCAKHRLQFENPKVAYSCTTCDAVTLPGHIRWVPL
jgi:hypothetical protein